MSPSREAHGVVTELRPRGAVASFLTPPHDVRHTMHKNYADLVAEAKRTIAEVTPLETMQLRSDANTVIVDCREPNEFNLGAIPGAYKIPRGLLEQNIEGAARRDQKVILYCASGNRSALAAVVLREMGYTDVASMSSGFRGWVEAGGDVD